MCCVQKYNAMGPQAVVCHCIHDDRLCHTLANHSQSQVVYIFLDSGENHHALLGED